MKPTLSQVYSSESKYTGIHPFKECTAYLHTENRELNCVGTAEEHVRDREGIEFRWSQLKNQQNV
ncbi:UNVERIFIED_CONTAM: hypothetical protein FKN15_013323 [Acipenser sinensis]